MDTKKIIKLLLFISIVAFAIGYVLTNSVIFGLCEHSQYECRDVLNKIGDPFYYGFGALSVVFLLLAAFPQAFLSWKKFAIWFVPLATFLFIVYPEPGSGDLFSPYPEQVFQWVSGLYIVVSLGIVGWRARG